MSFAIEIEKRRRARGMSQEQLAAAASLSRSSVMHAEQGAPVSARTARQLANALEWPVEDAIAMSRKIPPRKRLPTVKVQGPVATTLIGAALAAGVPIDVYLASLLKHPAASGKRKK